MRTAAKRLVAARLSTLTALVMCALPAHSTNFVVRTLPRFYTPGIPVTVTLSNYYGVSPSGFAAYVIESVPTNWSILNYTTNGFLWIIKSTNYEFIGSLLLQGSDGFASNVVTYSALPTPGDSGTRYFRGKGWQAGWVQPTAGDTRIDFDADGDGIGDAPPLSLISVLPNIRLCWPSETNRSYQVQGTPTLLPLQWANLGPLTAGTGNTNCVDDEVPPDQSQRFYRLLELPSP